MISINVFLSIGNNNESQIISMTEFAISIEA